MHAVSHQRVIHEGDNLSDHSPLCATVNIDTQYKHTHCNYNAINNSPQWDKADDCHIKAYQVALDKELSRVTIPFDAISCNNYLCTHHMNDIECLHDAIINACLTASQKTIPLKKGTDVYNRAGWKEFVQSYRNEAIQWHKLWKSNHSPHTGYFADMRKASRSRYHYAVRYVKRNEEAIAANKLADCLVNNKGKQFWQEVKKKKGIKSQVPNSIDNKSDEQDICNVFADKYESLLNSVSFNAVEMNCILNDISSGIKSECCKGTCYSPHVISTDAVVDAIKELKPNKRDGHSGCQSDHVIHGTRKLHVLMSQLLNTMLVHGFAPDSFLLCTVTSIPKNNRKSLNDSSNYRGIALSSIIGKVFDWIILKHNRDKLKTSDLQFGFKPGHSTTQCTFLLEEVAQHYVNNDNNIYIMLLDASQAFDRVNYCKLFRLLLTRGLCPLHCRFLAYSYTKQRVKVKWGRVVSRPFLVSNGVKQGGVLSPILFIVYLDELIACLRSAGVGCYMGRHFVGAPSYADDLTLLTPTKYSMYTLLKVTSDFAQEYDVKFNAAKCQLVVLGPNGPVDDQISFLDKIIVSQPSATHLGHTIGHNVCEQKLQNNINDMIITTNTLSSLFPKADINVKYKLFKCYAMSLYGCQVWDFSHKGMSRVYTTWRKCIRKLFKLPYRTHSELLPVLCKDLPMSIQLYKRFIKFIHNALNGTNDCLKACAMLALYGSSSSVCNNINLIASALNMSKYLMLNNNLTSLLCKLDDLYTPHAQTTITASQICDLLSVPFNELMNFSQQDIDVMIEFLSCS